jgi:hypothetical protein
VNLGKKLGIVLAGALLFGFIYFYGYPKARIEFYKYRANTVIELIEEYETKHGNYPSSIDELTVCGYEWLSYDKLDKGYRVFFLSGFYWYVTVYSSELGEWYEAD